MTQITSRVGKRGTVVVPAKLRSRYDLEEGALVIADELIQHCRDRLAHYKYPNTVEFVEALPRTGSGKISKKALRSR